MYCFENIKNQRFVSRSKINSKKVISSKSKNATKFRTISHAINNTFTNYNTFTAVNALNILWWSTVQILQLKKLVKS